jgi:rod shape-determining protein MreC
MNRRKNIIAITLFMVGLAFIFLMSPQNVQRLQSGFLSLISPFLRTGSDWERQYKSYRAGLKKLNELESDVSKLRVENERLKALNQALQGVEAENIRLNEALGFQTQTPFSLISARVIGRNPSNWWSTVDIDRGSDDGVQKEMCVLTPEGLVGKVIAISSNGKSATVLLVTDETCKVAGTVEGTERQGIIRVDVRGERGSNKQHPVMTLNYLSKAPELVPGQKLRTSGAGYVYPAGIMIGEVVEFKSREMDGSAILQPAVDFATLQDVFVVTGMKTNPAK